mmetsp:Transcript_10489/g.29152  ORF Transcript_10489/g.29152 Transcript_10489/m.29152 type:complete len:277 (-) Transcript_10489:242-1072(-)
MICGPFCAIQLACPKPSKRCKDALGNPAAMASACCLGTLASANPWYRFTSTWMARRSTTGVEEKLDTPSRTAGHAPCAKECPHEARSSFANASSDQSVASGAGSFSFIAFATASGLARMATLISFSIGQARRGGPFMACASFTLSGIMPSGPAGPQMPATMETLRRRVSEAEEHKAAAHNAGGPPPESPTIETASRPRMPTSSRLSRAAPLAVFGNRPAPKQPQLKRGGASGRWSLWPKPGREGAIRRHLGLAAPSASAAMRANNVLSAPVPGKPW